MVTYIQNNLSSKGLTLGSQNSESPDCGQWQHSLTMLLKSCCDNGVCQEFSKVRDYSRTTYRYKPPSSVRLSSFPTRTGGGTDRTDGRTMDRVTTYRYSSTYLLPRGYSRTYVGYQVRRAKGGPVYLYWSWKERA
eukprot:scaffold58947_cov30-Attheya_sp.AAC.1